ncbi:Uncharacterised protein [Shigella sonnei]|nr:Uncharacterised protein [Shigella sonnei]
MSSVFSENAMRNFFSTMLLLMRRSGSSAGADSSLPRFS